MLISFHSLKYSTIPHIRDIRILFRECECFSFCVFFCLFIVSIIPSHIILHSFVWFQKCFWMEVSFGQVLTILVTFPVDFTHSPFSRVNGSFFYLAMRKISIFLEQSFLFVNKNLRFYPNLSFLKQFSRKNRKMAAFLHIFLIHSNRTCRGKKKFYQA